MTDIIAFRVTNIGYPGIIIMGGTVLELHESTTFFTGLDHPGDAAFRDFPLSLTNALLGAYDQEIVSVVEVLFDNNSHTIGEQDAEVNVIPFLRGVVKSQVIVNNAIDTLASFIWFRRKRKLWVLDLDANAIVSPHTAKYGSIVSPFNGIRIELPDFDEDFDKGDVIIANNATGGGHGGTLTVRYERRTGIFDVPVAEGHRLKCHGLRDEGGNTVWYSDGVETLVP